MYHKWYACHRLRSAAMSLSVSICLNFQPNPEMSLLNTAKAYVNVCPVCSGNESCDISERSSTCGDRSHIVCPILKTFQCARTISSGVVEKMKYALYGVQFSLKNITMLFLVSNRPKIWSTVILKKLIVGYLAKIFPALYGT
jgi:hypothetical protein